MTSQDVDAVILSYRTAKLAVDAARSAHANRVGSIVVVDNHSGDDSVAILRAAVGDFADILELPGNHGFPAGNNAGARVGNRQLILFMNSDARLHDGAVATMVRAFMQDAKIGAVAPSLQYPNGQPQASAYFFITPKRLVSSVFGIHRLAKRIGSSFLAGNVDFKRNGTYSGEVESLYGPCILVRRTAFEKIGGFDEAFFLYCEETDFFLRLAKSGYRAFRVAAAQATHNHGESAKQSPIASSVLMQEGRRIYAKKHFGRLGRLVTALASVGGIVLRLLLSRSAHERRRHLATLGVWLGWTPTADPRKCRPLQMEARNEPVTR